MAGEIAALFEPGQAYVPVPSAQAAAPAPAPQPSQVYVDQLQYPPAAPEGLVATGPQLQAPVSAGALAYRPAAAAPQQAIPPSAPQYAVQPVPTAQTAAPMPWPPQYGGQAQTALQPQYVGQPQPATTATPPDPPNALTRFGNTLQANGLMTDPMVEGAFASVAMMGPMVGFPIIGSIIGAFYADGHLFKFLGECFSGHFNWHTLRELAGGLICGAAAAVSFMCPALSILNAGALGVDTLMEVMEIQSRVRAQEQANAQQLGPNGHPLVYQQLPPGYAPAYAPAPQMMVPQGVQPGPVPQVLMPAQAQ